MLPRQCSHAAAIMMKRMLLALPVLAASGPTALAAGMPQLDFANPLTDWQVIWGAVIFVLLYLLLSRSALPQVASVLEQRRDRIDGDLEAARQTKSEADHAIEALRLERRRANAEAKANIDRVVNEARQEAAVRTREMNIRLEAELAEAEAGIASERQRAMGSLRQVASDTAQLLVERVTGRPADRALVESRVDGLLSDRAAAAAAIAGGPA